MKFSRCFDRLTIRFGLPVESGRGVNSSDVFSVSLDSPVSPELRLLLTASVSSDTQMANLFHWFK